MYFEFQALVFIVSSFYNRAVDGFGMDSRRVEKFTVYLVATKAEMYQAWFSDQWKSTLFSNESQL